MTVIGICKSCPEDFAKTFNRVTAFFGEKIILSHKPERCDIFITNKASGKLPSIKEHGTVIALDTTKADFVSGKPVQVITCGLSSANTVTASSIDTDIDVYRFNYCLKETVTTLSGKSISQQEIPVSLPIGDDCDITAVLATFTVLLLSDKAFVINKRKSEYL